MKLITLAPQTIQETDQGQNPNVMEADEYGRLRDMIAKEGFLQPPLVRALDGGAYEAIDGTHRVRAAKELGISEIPCVLIDAGDDLTRALRIGMNRLRGRLDLTRVAIDLDSLLKEGWDMDALSITGFAMDEVQDLLTSLQPAVDPLPEETPEEEPAGPRPFLLEIEFLSAQDLKRARRALKRAAGKGGTLAQGLLRMLDG